MVRNCFVKGCDSKYFKGTTVTFHSFPQDEKMSSKWEEAIRTATNQTNVTTHNLESKVCSKHFQPECFILPQYSFQKTTLKKTAVPSLFNFAADISEEEYLEEDFLQTTTSETSTPEVLVDEESYVHSMDEILEQIKTIIYSVDVINYLLKEIEKRDDIIDRLRCNTDPNSCG